MTCPVLLPADADRDTWLARRREGVSASEVAALLGLSPWDSPFSLFWRKRLGWEATPNEEMRTGTFLEPTIAAWFATQHPEVTITEAGLYRHHERAWQLATPDRLIGERDRLWGLECKYSGHSWTGWGEPLTDQIPVHYRCQALWQLDVLDAEITAVSVLGPGGFREFVVHRDERDLQTMRERASRFIASLTAGQPPDVDDHPATLATIRQVNTQIENRAVEIPDGIAEGWLRSRRFKDLAIRVERRYAAAIRAQLGTAKTATNQGRVIATRSTDNKLITRRGTS